MTRLLMFVTIVALGWGIAGMLHSFGLPTFTGWGF